MNMLLKELGNEIKNHEQIKKRRLKRKREKQQKKKFIVSHFGKTRYILSYWFGQGALYSCNSKFYNKKKIAEPLTQQPSKVLYLSNYR